MAEFSPAMVAKIHRLLERSDIDRAAVLSLEEAGHYLRVRQDEIQAELIRNGKLRSRIAGKLRKVQK